MSDQDKIWQMADSMKICMLTSWNGSRQQSRPMGSRVRRNEHAIYFLDKANSEKEAEIAKFSAVALSYSDHGANNYLAIAGHAKVSNDRAKIAELWSDIDKSWFDGPQDPNIRLITVAPESAEFWDSPNRLVAGAKMLMAAATGDKPDMGENRRVAV